VAERSDLVGRLPVVYCGKPVEEWYSLYCQAVLRLHKAETLLQAAYAGMHKDHWAEGESEAAVCEKINDHFVNYHNRPV
jgi:hypothetical protein